MVKLKERYAAKGNNMKNVSRNEKRIAKNEKCEIKMENTRNDERKTNEIRNIQN
jgi:hypothetical protein